MLPHLQRRNHRATINKHLIPLSSSPLVARYHSSSLTFYLEGPHVLHVVQCMLRADVGILKYLRFFYAFFDPYIFCKSVVYASPVFWSNKVLLFFYFSSNGNIAVNTMDAFSQLFTAFMVALDLHLKSYVRTSLSEKQTKCNFIF